MTAAPVSQVLSEAADLRQTIARTLALYGLGTVSGTDMRGPPNASWTQAEWERRVLQCVPESVEQQCYALADAIIDGTGLSGAYLVWSNEHQAWWGPGHCGYTRHIERAGRYDRAEALSIAGMREGGWHVCMGNPDEIAIPERDAVEQYAAITAALAKEQGR